MFLCGLASFLGRGVEQGKSVSYPKGKIVIGNLNFMSICPFLGRTLKRGKIFTLFCKVVSSHSPKSCVSCCRSWLRIFQCIFEILLFHQLETI